MADAFWATDLSLSKDNIDDGTTATVLMACFDAANERMSCLLAHVGDSTAVAVDMLSAGAHSGAVCKRISVR